MGCFSLELWDTLYNIYTAYITHPRHARFIVIIICLQYRFVVFLERVPLFRTISE
ncbi:unnamed protein product [Phyllotreta striolata]|uniref:Uncharacterized protein n=1 Tax=Phyllotreta striolata TaxID=444603 RepID=A0A9N9XMY2_PHYSR|nr:unnamed protein product [Phyllotreta striolata]